MIKRLFTGKINSITMAALIVALSSLVSRFLGIFRDRILAGEFGAGDTLDVYYAAFRIPDLIFNLLVLGALSAGFIPIFTKLLNDPLRKAKDVLSGDKYRSAWELASNVLHLLVFSLIILSGLGIIFAPLLMKLVAPGFSVDKQILTASLTRIMFLSPIFLGISSIFGGILQSFKRFFVYSLAPIMYNIGIIIGALYFVPIWGIYGLAWGVVFGALLHFLVQMPTVMSLGFNYVPFWRHPWWDKKIKELVIMMVPRTMSLAISQINLVVITIVASTLASGSLAVFNFANNLQSFPIGIFGISFAVAAFPTLSALAFNKDKLVNNFSVVFRQILFFIVPATVLLLTLRAQIIRVILGTGQFDWGDTIATIDTLGFFTISLFAQASLPLLVRMFYARHNAKTPFIVGMTAVLVNVILSLSLPKLTSCQLIVGSNGALIEQCLPLGVSGLALAFSIASIFNFVFLWIMLRIEIGGMDEYRILVSAVKFSAAAIMCGITVQGMKLLMVQYLNIDMTRLWGVLSQGLAAGTSGILVYIAFCSLLGSEELLDFWHSLKRRLPGRRIEAGDQGEARGI